MPQRSSTHSHKSSTTDEAQIGRDLRTLRQFKKEDGRNFDSFVGIPHDPNYWLDDSKFVEWINRLKRNILLHYPAADQEESEQSSDCESD